MMDETTSLADAFGSAEMLLRLEDHHRARAALDAIAQVAPDAARLHLFEGWLALAGGPAGVSPSTGGSRSTAKTASSAPAGFALLTPDALAASGGAKGAVLGRSYQGALAAKHFRMALGRDPLEPLAWHGLTAALPEGKERLAAAARASRLQHSEAVADLRRGKPYLAKAPLELLHADQPDQQEWAILLAECLRRLGNRDAALELLRPLLERVPLAAPAALLAAALTEDGTQRSRLLAEAARGDPAWSTARRLWAGDRPPIALPRTPEVILPASVVQRIAEIGERPALLDNGDWRVMQVPARPTQPVPRLPRDESAGTRAAPHAASLGAKGAAGMQPQPVQEPDQEAMDVLREVQRATQRFFGQPPTPLASGGGVVALLVTHRGSLQRRYGAETAAEVERRMQRLGQALGERGIVAQMLIVDQPQPRGAAPALESTGEAGAKAIADLIRAERARLESAQRRLDTILLVGGDSIVPFHRRPNPSQDGDQEVCSDNPYGCAGGTEHVPDIVVARLPDGGADGGELLLALLQRSIEYHEGWLIPQPSPPGVPIPFLRRLVANARAKAPVGASGASTESWREPSDEIYRGLESQRPLLVCPPDGPDTLNIGGRGEASWGRILYFNLHGLSGGPNWYGQAASASPDDALPVAITPQDVEELEAATICLTEACYGAEILSRSSGDAMVLRFLSRGALAFIGSTATAYGSVGLPLGGADLIAQQVFQNLRRGQPIGRALLLARDWIARETVEKQGYLDPDDAKTLLSFVLLGDPWATPYAKPAMQSKLALPHIEPIVAQRRPLQVNAISPAAAEVAHKLVTKLAPQFARASITALGQGRPDRIAKGHAGAIVFSAAAQVPTVDGRRTEQIARITVAHGAARKVLLTR